MTEELVKLKLENIALKSQILEMQYQELKTVSSNLQSERHVIIESLRKKLHASSKDVFNPVTLKFDKPESKLKSVEKV